MTFIQIMEGRMTLVGAQRSLANRVMHLDGDALRVDTRANFEALMIFRRAIESLDRELVVKQCRRDGYRRRSANADRTK
jgi:hypothetical protein